MKLQLPGYAPMILGALLQLWQAGEYVARRDYPLAFTFVAYAFVNVMFIWDFVRRVQ